MRSRIKMSILSANPDGIISRHESREISAKHMRHANFMKSRSKLSLIKHMDINLLMFNYGIEEAIKQFRADKKCVVK